MTTITIQNLLLLTQQEINELSISQEEVYNLMKELRILPNATRACLGIYSLPKVQIIKILQLFMNKVDNSKPLRSHETYKYQGHDFQLFMISIHGIDAFAQIVEPRLTFGYNQATETFILTSYQASDHKLDGHVNAHNEGWNRITAEITDEIPEKGEQRLVAVDLSSIKVDELVSKNVERSDLDTRAENLIATLVKDDPEKTEELCQELKTVSKRLSGRKNKPATLEFLHAVMKFLVANQLVEKEIATVNNLIKMIPLLLASGDSLDPKGLSELIACLNPILIPKLQDSSCASFTLKTCTQLFSLGLLNVQVSLSAIDKIVSELEQLAQWILSDSFISLPEDAQTKIVQSFFELASPQSAEVVFSKEVNDATVEACRLLPTLKLIPSKACIESFVRIPVNFQNLKYSAIATHLLSNINEPALQENLLSRIVSEEMKPSEAASLMDTVLAQNVPSFLKLFCTTLALKSDIKTNLNNLLIFVSLIDGQRIPDCQKQGAIGEFLNQVVAFLNGSSPDNYAKTFLDDLEILFDFVLNHLNTYEQLTNFFDSIKTQNKKNINVLTLPENICKKIIDKACVFIGAGQIIYNDFVFKSDLLVNLSKNSVSVYDYYIDKMTPYESKYRQQLLTEAYATVPSSLDELIKKSQNQISDLLTMIKQIEKMRQPKTIEQIPINNQYTVFKVLKPMPEFTRVSMIANSRGKILVILRSLINHMNRVKKTSKKSEKVAAGSLIRQYEPDQIMILQDFEKKYINDFMKHGDQKERDLFFSGMLLLNWYLYFKTELLYQKDKYDQKMQEYSSYISSQHCRQDPILAKIIISQESVLDQLEEILGCPLMRQDESGGRITYVSNPYGLKK